MPETIFISYRSLDSVKVDSIVTRLRALKNPNGTPCYRIWQDKDRNGDGIPPGADWWESIVDAIIQCRVFVFMMSAESVKNENCRAELRYAYARNRHILPVVLNGEFFHNASGKEDVGYMKDIPQELQDLRAQFLFDNGQQAYNQLEAKLADWVANPRRDTDAPRPKDPSQDDNNDYVFLYDEACDFAWRLEFDKAERKFRLLTRRTGHGFDHEAYQWLEIFVKYKDLIRCYELKSARHKVPQMWRDYTQTYAGRDFLKVFNDDGLFDPEGFKAIYDGGAQPQTPPPNNTPVRTTFLSPMPQPVIETLPPPKIFTPPIPSFLPQPFEWCKIDGGNVTLKALSDGYLNQDTTLHVEEFFMAKYPTTNAQYQAFVDAPDGYKNPDWWNYSKGAKAWRKANPQPAKTAFAGDDHPRTNITWYESVAFTLWLSNKLAVNIHLPTDEQWQRAAIGDTNNIYPWGNQLDDTYANYNRNIGQTTPVTAYPKNVSPFGVMDMGGNVWEWCFTSYDKGNIPLKDAVDDRYYVLRGGSWRHNLTNILRADVRAGFNPDDWNNFGGVRFACSK